MQRLVRMGMMPYRQKNARGSFKPHLAVKFRSEEGNLRSFFIDSTRVAAKYPQPDAYLITHAHSDHHGSSAMLSECSICTEKTMNALEVRHSRNFKGNLAGENGFIDYGGVKIRTYPTHHTDGSVAFGWENENGMRILATGDVKDASNLPSCDVLITEANYGDPADLSCYFEDDLEGFYAALKSPQDVAFGAYPFGKAQRVVRLIRQSGYEGPIGMDDKSQELTQNLLEDAGELVSMDAGAGVNVVSPGKLEELPLYMSKYMITGRRDHRFPSINISDHLDASGLEKMVLDIDPEFVVVYHPAGHRPSRFACHLNTLGYDAVCLADINNVVSNEFM
nr:MBL fold metallo-hydrolase [Methanohalophilus mahii]